MKQDFVDYVNFLAKDLPNGSVNSEGLEDTVLVLYNTFLNEYLSPKQILLEHAYLIATKQLIENHIERFNLIHPVRNASRPQQVTPISTFQPVHQLKPNQQSSHQQLLLKKGWIPRLYSIPEHGRDYPPDVVHAKHLQPMQDGEHLS